MKRYVFILLLAFAIAAASTGVVYADTLYPEEGNELKMIQASYTEEICGNEVTYEFKLYADYVSIKSSEYYVLYVDSTGEEHFLLNTSDLTYKTFLEDDGSIYLTTITGSGSLSTDTDVSYFIFQFYHQGSSFSWKREQLKATCTSSTEVEPSVTPEVTPDPTESPDPSVSPDPIPTNAPTPTPTPTPELFLNAYVDGQKAVAIYETGGCEAVQTKLEFYEVDTLSDSLIKLDSLISKSKAGKVEKAMELGKVYRYRLEYTYEIDGIRYQAEIWSQDLTLVDQELEDYKNTGNITNYRTLILWVWNNFMELELPVEGYNIKIRTLFIWFMIGSLGVWFFTKWTGS